MQKLLFVILLCGMLFAESTYEEKAREALKKITTEQIDKIKQTSNSTKSKDEKNLKGFVLSTHIKNFSDIPKSIDRDILRIKKQTELLIKSIALDIEINRGSSSALILDDNGNVSYSPNSNLPENLNNKREELLRANLNNSISIKSVSLAFLLLVDINKEVMEKALVAKDIKTKERLYMTQAIYVYEMSDIVLKLLDSISLDGKDTILKLHSDAKKRVSLNIKNIENQKIKAEDLKENGLISQKDLEKELSSLDLMAKATQRSLESWETIISKIGDQEKFLDNLKNKRELIAYKKSKAKLQIETLRDLRGVAELKDSIGSLDDIIDSVTKLDLLVLDEDTVSELLGYESDD